MSIVKFGLIGVGGRGKTFRKFGHRPEAGCVIAAGADINPAALEEFRRDFPDAAVYQDWKELIADPELQAVFIITPDFLHEEIAIAAMRAGKDVYLEKPIAITIEGGERILRTAMETKRKLYLGHNMRYFAVIRKMKELVDSGVIGEVQAGWCRHFVNYGGDAYFRDWHSERKNTNGLLLQKGCHDIDVMHFIMGSYTKRVVGMGMLSVYDKCARRLSDESAQVFDTSWNTEHYPPEKCDGFSPVIDVEDHNMVLMQLASGAQACYLQCHYTPDSCRNYTFIGTRGRIENSAVSGEAKIMVWTRRDVPPNPPDIVYNVRVNSDNHTGSDPEIIKNFQEYVQGIAPAAVNPIDAFRAVEVGVLAHESMRGDIASREIPEPAPELVAYFADAIKG